MEKEFLTVGMTPPDEKVVRKAKRDAKKIFPNDKQKQEEYVLRKGSETMKCKIIN